MVSNGAQYYQEISVTIPTVEVDPVSNYIIENVCGGLLLEDEDEASHTTIKFYVAEGADIAAHLAGLKKYLGAINPAHAKIEFGQKRIKDLDWIEAYKKSVEPVAIGDAIVIKPPWNDDSFPGQMEILIEPKMAFGTGRHESTRGCLAELERIDLTGKIVLDLGCGSGILGIYAAKKGAVEVLGYDIDPLAVENSIENFEINEVASVCRAYIGTVADVTEEKRFDVIVVNIIKSVIVPIIPDLKNHLVPGGAIILAGLLEQDRPEVEAALVKNNLDSFNIRTDNEWVTYSVRGK